MKTRRGQSKELLEIVFYLEAVIHGLSKPDMLLLLDVLAYVPVLLSNLTLSW